MGTCLRRVCGSHCVQARPSAAVWIPYFWQIVSMYPCHGASRLVAGVLPALCRASWGPHQPWLPMHGLLHGENENRVTLSFKQ